MAASLMNRLIARWQGWTIDDRLLAGRPADGDPVTVARLSHLLDPRHRAAIAKGLRKMLGVARGRRLSPFLAQIPLRVREVLEMEPLILTLARELEEEENVNPRGVILADRLIRDGDSPLYWRSPMDVSEPAGEQSVELAVKHARAALHLG
jgi:hypothetical protein